MGYCTGMVQEFRCPSYIDKDTKLDDNTPIITIRLWLLWRNDRPLFFYGSLELVGSGVCVCNGPYRGGQYLGRPWYENGKLLNKKNTFTDFIDCSKYLISKEYTSAGICMPWAGQPEASYGRHYEPGT